MARRRLPVFPAVTATAVAVAALLVTSAWAGTRSGWQETAKVGGKPVLSFEVAGLSIRKSSWSANVSFRNLSGKTIRVEDFFGLALFRTSKITPTMRPDALGHAVRFSPRRPLSLDPGASWTGVIGGKGLPQPTLSGKVYARIVFGPFFGVPGISGGYFWVTDHARTLTLGRGGPGGLVI
jgi:hypothetical protein